jgi:protein-S-isoprenylcysteine O-methyltransferase Ste14
MYLSMTIVYLGVALMMQSVWSFLLLPLVIALIQTQVIRREEAYMERRFGAEYVRFKRKVRRWI